MTEEKDVVHSSSVTATKAQGSIESDPIGLTPDQSQPIPMDAKLSAQSLGRCSIEIKEIFSTLVYLYSGVNKAT